MILDVASNPAVPAWRITIGEQKPDSLSGLADHDSRTKAQPLLLYDGGYGEYPTIPELQKLSPHGGPTGTPRSGSCSPSGPPTGEPGSTAPRGKAQWKSHATPE